MPLNMFKLSSDLFTDRSKAVLLLWILFDIYVSGLVIVIPWFVRLYVEIIHEL